MKSHLSALSVEEVLCQLEFWKHILELTLDWKLSSVLCATGPSRLVVASGDTWGSIMTFDHICVPTVKKHSKHHSTVKNTWRLIGMLAIFCTNFSMEFSSHSLKTLGKAALLCSNCMCLNNVFYLWVANLRYLCRLSKLWCTVKIKNCSYK